MQFGTLAQPSAPIAPARIVALSPSFYVPSWEPKASRVGLKTISDWDVQTARAEAYRLTEETHGSADTEGKIEAFNDALLAWAVACGVCDPEDVAAPFMAMPQDNLRLAFTSEGIRRLWDELEILHVASSPVSRGADASDLVELGELLTADAPLAGLSTAAGLRVSKLLAFCLEELRAARG